MSLPYHLISCSIPQTVSAKTRARHKSQCCPKLRQISASSDFDNLAPFWLQLKRTNSGRIYGLSLAESIDSLGDYTEKAGVGGSTPSLAQKSFVLQ
jgi:hypothetical protein